jgi:hypothetical protein
MRQHQPIAARLRTIKKSSKRRVERGIAKALEGNRHAKPTENCELSNCQLGFRNSSLSRSRTGFMAKALSFGIVGGQKTVRR